MQETKATIKQVAGGKRDWSERRRSQDGNRLCESDQPTKLFKVGWSELGARRGLASLMNTRHRCSGTLSRCHKRSFGPHYPCLNVT